MMEPRFILRPYLYGQGTSYCTTLLTFLYEAGNHVLSFWKEEMFEMLVGKIFRAAVP